MNGVIIRCFSVFFFGSIVAACSSGLEEFEDYSISFDKAFDLQDDTGQRVLNKIASAEHFFWNLSNQNEKSFNSNDTEDRSSPVANAIRYCLELLKEYNDVLIELSNDKDRDANSIYDNLESIFSTEKNLSIYTKNTLEKVKTELEEIKHGLESKTKNTIKKYEKLIHKTKIQKDNLAKMKNKERAEYSELFVRLNNAQEDFNQASEGFKHESLNFSNLMKNFDNMKQNLQNLKQDLQNLETAQQDPGTQQEFSDIQKRIKEVKQKIKNLEQKIENEKITLMILKELLKFQQRKMKYSQDKIGSSSVCVGRGSIAQPATPPQGGAQTG